MRSKKFFKVLIILLITLFSIGVLARSSYFGNKGRDGSSGRTGRPGENGRDVSIMAQSGSQTFNIQGKIGQNGRDGERGEDARGCRQPNMPRYNLKGADGGDAGYGGDGGRGGNGGNATIFYDSISQLQNIVIKNGGGAGGEAGYAGEYGGYGCKCELYSWEYFECNWQLMRREYNDPYARWRPAFGYGSRETTDCTGDMRYDRRHYRPHRFPHNADYGRYEYRWEFEGYDTQRYTCRDGRDGGRGHDGYRGDAGTYGDVRIVKGKSIPNDNPIFKGPIKASLNKFYDLTRNVWSSETGLERLLGAGSDVKTTYQKFITTDKFKVTIWWRVSDGPGAYNLHDKEFKVWLTRDENNEPTFKAQFPEGVEYTVEKLDAKHFAVRVVRVNKRMYD